jgi:hypothetical protein
MGHVGSQYPPKANGSEQQWCECPGSTFSFGRENVMDDKAPQWRSTGDTMRNSFRKTGLSTSWHVAFDHGLCYSTVQQHQGVGVIIPKGRALTDNWRVARMIGCLRLLHCYAVKQKNCFHQVVTSDEEWIYHFTPTKKQSNMDWNHST